MPKTLNERAKEYEAKAKALRDKEAKQREIASHKAALAKLSGKAKKK